MTGASHISIPARSLVLLVGMLMLGVVIGAAGMIVFGGRPMDRKPPQGPDGGFVAHMVETIRPADAEQRAAMLPILQATDRRNRAEVDRSRAAMRAHLDSMLVLLTPILDAEQQDRLTQLISRLGAPGGPPPGGSGRGPPPPRP